MGLAPQATEMNSQHQKMNISAAQIKKIRLRHFLYLIKGGGVLYMFFTVQYINSKLSFKPVKDALSPRDSEKIDFKAENLISLSNSHFQTPLV